MCLTPIRIVNPTYKKIRRTVSKDDWDSVKDELLHQPNYSLLVPCGKCSECIRAKAKMWRWRLIREYELSNASACYFVLLTVSPEFIDDVNANPSPFFRAFFEKLRYKLGASPRHWFTTEYGTRRTKRIHFHGIFFDCPPRIVRLIADCWTYGLSSCSRLRAKSGCTYVSKYITKDFGSGRRYSGKVFCSSGIGSPTYSLFSSSLARFSFANPASFTKDGRNYSIPYYYITKFVPEDIRRFHSCLRRCVQLNELLDTLSNPLSTRHALHLDRRRLALLSAANSSMAGKSRAVSRFCVDDAYPLKVDPGEIDDCIEYVDYGLQVLKSSTSNHYFYGLDYRSATRSLSEVKRSLVAHRERYH